VKHFNLKFLIAVYKVATSGSENKVKGLAGHLRHLKPSPALIIHLTLQHPADFKCVRCVAQTLWTVMFRGTLEIEFGLKTIDPVSLWGLSVKLDAPLSLYKVMSRQSGSRIELKYIQELPASPQTKMRN
jgi:hypothetical protein